MEDAIHQGVRAQDDSNGGLREVMCPDCGAPYGYVSDPFSERQCKSCRYHGVFNLIIAEVGNDVSMVTIGLGITQSQEGTETRPGEP